MEDQLISFETAKLAKEKGFNSDCNFYYKISKYENIKGPSNLDGKRSWNHVIPPIEYFSVPTQSLLQKWLREKHNIHVHPSFDQIKYHERLYEVNILIENKSESFGFEHIYKSLDHSSYEEALEEGLQQALKLIK